MELDIEKDYAQPQKVLPQACGKGNAKGQGSYVTPVNTNALSSNMKRGKTTANGCNPTTSCFLCVQQDVPTIRVVPAEFPGMTCPEGEPASVQQEMQCDQWPASGPTVGILPFIKCLL